MSSALLVMRVVLLLSSILSMEIHDLMQSPLFILHAGPLHLKILPHMDCSASLMATTVLQQPNISVTPCARYVCWRLPDHFGYYHPQKEL